MSDTKKSDSELDKMWAESAMETLVSHTGAFVMEDKFTGSDHCKTWDVEPIDLYKAGGMFVDFALCNIIKYAFRQREVVNKKDLQKIVHYAQLLMEHEKE